VLQFTWRVFSFFQDKFPKCLLEVSLTILEDCGSVIAACITAAGLALMEAGVPVYDLPVGVTLVGHIGITDLCYLIFVTESVSLSCSSTKTSASFLTPRRTSWRRLTWLTVWRVARAEGAWRWGTCLHGSRFASLPWRGKWILNSCPSAWTRWPKWVPKSLQFYGTPLSRNQMKTHQGATKIFHVYFYSNK